MPKINLAQETMRNQAIARRRRLVYLFSIIVLAIAGIFYFSVLFLTKNTEAQIAVVDQRIKSLEQQLKTREVAAKEIKAFSLRLINVENLLKNHVRWSVALGELERLVLPSVKVLALSSGTDMKEITMDVQTPNIETAADLVVSLVNTAKLNETFFGNVTATGLSSDATSATTGKTFSTKLKFFVKPEGLADKNISVSYEMAPVDNAQSTTSPDTAVVNPIIP